MNKEDALQAVTHRNNFYKDKSKLILIALLISIILNTVLAYSIFYSYTNPPKPKYFATSSNGRITKLYPLSAPNLSDAAVLQWATRASLAAFSYNFVNFRSELQAASGFFTPSGWTQFLNALTESNNLEAVKSKKLVVSAVARRTPVIITKGIVNGNYSWVIEVPLLITYQSGSDYSQTRDTVSLTVQRVSTLNSPQGIGISQFVVIPGGSD
jgi:intracellular multiplication protein IcmL